MNFHLHLRFFIGSVLALVFSSCSTQPDSKQPLNGTIHVSTFMDEHDSIYVYAELDQEWIGNHVLQFDFSDEPRGTEIVFKDTERIHSRIIDTVKPSISIPLHRHTADYGSHLINFKLNSVSNQGTLHIDSIGPHLSISDEKNVISADIQ